MPALLGLILHRVEALEVKEIFTPDWQTVGPSSEPVAPAEPDSAAPSPLEDLSDAAYIRRHQPCEAIERQRYLGLLDNRKRKRSSQSLTDDAANLVIDVGSHDPSVSPSPPGYSPDGLERQSSSPYVAAGPQPAAPSADVHVPSLSQAQPSPGLVQPSPSPVQPSPSLVQPCPSAADAVASSSTKAAGGPSPGVASAPTGPPELGSRVQVTLSSVAWPRRTFPLTGRDLSALEASDKRPASIAADAMPAPAPLRLVLRVTPAPT